MKSLVLVLLAVGVFVAFAIPTAQACGDKFLVSSQYQTQARMNTHAGVILLYRTPQSHVANQVLDDKLKKNLEHRGHKVETVENSAELQKAVQGGKVDLVIGEVEYIGDPSNDGPKVMPVVLGADFIEVEKLKEIYGAVLQGDAKTSKQTEVIDEAMKQTK